METIKYYLQIYKKQALFGISLTGILLIACISFFAINHKFNAEEISIEEDLTAFTDIKNENINTELKSSTKIKVDIKGEVNKPGVYELDENKRVIDAVEMAGGLTNDAYTEIINLSQVLTDEDIIIIYNKNDYKNENLTKDIENNAKIYNEPKNGVISKKTETTTNIKTTNNNTTSSNNKKESPSLNPIVNINSASKDTLMTLNGIGESKASLIIEYRNTNGGFKSIEEIKNVKGIGDAIYAKIKDNITV